MLGQFEEKEGYYSVLVRDGRGNPLYMACVFFHAGGPGRPAEWKVLETYTFHSDFTVR